MVKSPFFWGILNRIVQQCLSFINTMILARFLSPREFGTIGVLAIFISICSILSDTGMGGSIIKEQRLTKEDCSTVLCYNFCFSLFLYLLLFFAAPYLEAYFNIKGLAKVSRWATLPLIINAVAIVPRSLCAKKLEFNKAFYITFLSTLLSMIVAIFMARKGYGVWALVSYSIVLAMLDNIGYHIVERYLPRIGFSKKSFNKLFSFGLFTSLSTIVDVAYENILSVLIGRNIGVVEVGYYSQAKKIEEAPSQSLSVTISTVAFPMLSKLIDSPIDFKKLSYKIQSTLLSLGTPIMIIIAVFPKPIICFLLGNQWEEASHYLSILCFAGIFKILETTNRTFIKSIGRADVLFKLSIVKRGFSIVVLLVAMNYGLVVLLWSYVLTSFLCAMINAYSLSLISGFSFFSQLKNVLIIALPNLVLYYILYLISSIDDNIPLTLLSIVLALLSYLLLLSYMDIINISSYLKNRNNEV